MKYRKHLATMFAVLAWLTAPSAWADTQPGRLLADRVAPFPQESALLWKIEGKGMAPSYLFGTIHVADVVVGGIPAPVQTALDGARRFLMEVVPDGDTLADSARVMFFSDGRDLKGVAGPALFADTAKALGQYGIPEDIAARMKPWAAATTLSLPPPSAGPVVDVRLYQSAVAAGKPALGLETAKEQLDILDALPLADQLAMLKETVNQLPKRDKLLQQMYRAYEHRDLGRLEMLSTQDAAADDPALAKRLTTALVDRRNVRMAARMTPYLEEGGAFVAVGALHLPGPKGLLQLLREKGYRVTPVY